MCNISPDWETQLAGAPQSGNLGTLQCDWTTFHQVFMHYLIMTNSQIAWGCFLTV